MCLTECSVCVFEQHVFYIVGGMVHTTCLLGPFGFMFVQIHCSCFDVLLSAVLVVSMDMLVISLSQSICL